MQSQAQRTRLAESGAIVIAGFVMAVVVLYVFARLANEVLEQETQTFDQATLVWLHQFSSPQLSQAAQLVSLFGSEAIWVIATILLTTYVWQQRWSAAATLVLVPAGAQILNDILKALFHRTRPEPLIGLVPAQSFSFPSGHAMVSAAFYFYLGYLGWPLVGGWRRVLLVAGLAALVLLIGLSRLYLEYHYLSDVVAGYLAGFLWANAVILGSRVLSVRRANVAQAR